MSKGGAMTTSSGRRARSRRRVVNVRTTDASRSSDQWTLRFEFLKRAYKPDIKNKQTQSSNQPAGNYFTSFHFRWAVSNSLNYNWNNKKERVKNGAGHLWSCHFVIDLKRRETLCMPKAFVAVGVSRTAMAATATTRLSLDVHIDCTWLASTLFCYIFRGWIRALIRGTLLLF